MRRGAISALLLIAVAVAVVIWGRPMFFRAFGGRSTTPANIAAAGARAFIGGSLLEGNERSLLSRGLYTLLSQNPDALGRYRALQVVEWQDPEEVKKTSEKVVMRVPFRFRFDSRYYDGRVYVTLRQEGGGWRITAIAVHLPPEVERGLGAGK